LGQTRKEGILTVTLPINEALAKGVCRTVVTKTWEPVPHVLADGDALRTYTTGQPLVIHCSPETNGLVFLRHAWSGSVSITVDGTSQVVELTHDTDEAVVVDLPEASSNFEVSIRSLLIDGRDVAHSEAWLLGLTFADAPLALGTSVALNQGTKIIYGDWGEFLALSSDAVIPDAIARFGAWAPGDIEVFRKYVPEGGVALDVGANIGHHSVVFSKLVGKDGLVIAVEAQRLMYQLINANLVLNRCANTIPIMAAAGAERGVVTMYPVSYDGAGGNFGALAINLSDEHVGVGEEVECYRLDELLPPYLRGRAVDFVKIDVQSYELFVLQGMSGIIERDKPTLFFEVAPVWMRQAGYEYTEMYSLLRGYGYDLIHREGTRLTPEGYPDLPPDIDVEWDVLAIHPSRARLS
jgi:FkbM family methyltransferase